MNILQITPNYLSKRCNNGSNDVKRNMSYPNLKPLAKDTVTFGNNKLVTELSKEVQESKMFQKWDWTNPRKMDEINALCEAFEAPLKKFKWDLKQSMKTILSTESNPDNVLMPVKRGIKSRVKDPKKVARKANKRNLSTIDDIARMGDVGGARIVLRSDKPENTAKVFENLKKLVKQGYKVKEIENYRSSISDSYVTQKTLDNFEAFCHKYKQYPLIKCKALPNKYTATHIAFELPDGKVIELQIMGRDMENFKEVEDLFYKYRWNENFSEQYKPIKKIFNRIMPKLDDFQQETLTRYITDSYEHARHIPERSSKNKFSPERAFLPFPYSLPQELNPVNLYYQMEKCNQLKH